MIYPNPGFPIYESLIRFCRATPMPVPLVESRDFSFDLDIFRSRISDRTRLVILNSPQNPTGGVIPAADIRAIADMVRGRDLMVLSDEIYARIHFGDEALLSIASLPGMKEQTIICDGFSKVYSMTGWRPGLGDHAAAAGGSGEQADGEFQFDAPPASHSAPASPRSPAHRTPTSA